MQTLLVVEEYEPQRLLCRIELEDEGYRVLTAGGGREAFQAVALERPDLAVVEPQMRGKSGWAMLQELRLAAPDLPVIVYTGNPVPPVDIVFSPPDVYLLKHSDLSPLKEAISRTLGQRRWRRASRSPVPA